MKWLEDWYNTKWGSNKIVGPDCFKIDPCSHSNFWTKVELHECGLCKIYHPGPQLMHEGKPMHEVFDSTLKIS